MARQRHETQADDTTRSGEGSGLPEPAEAPTHQDPDEGRHAELAPQGDSRDFALTLPHCGACRVGLLYPITYDPEATHEAFQGKATDHEQYVASGGSMVVRCFSCGNQQSQQLNAGGES